jgi:hypothetical protein
MKSTTSALKCVVQYLFCLFSTEQGALDSCSHDKGNGFHSVPQNTVILYWEGVSGDRKSGSLYSLFCRGQVTRFPVAVGERKRNRRERESEGERNIIHNKGHY